MWILRDVRTPATSPPNGKIKLGEGIDPTVWVGGRKRLPTVPPLKICF